MDRDELNRMLLEEDAYYQDIYYQIEDFVFSLGVSQDIYDAIMNALSDILL